MKAIIISGLLTHLSDNIIPFLDKKTDVYCYTWNTDWNGRWMIKLNRYKKYCNDIKVVLEKPKFDKKLYSYFYSTYKTVNMIEDIDKYQRIVKFKPNLDGDVPYVGDTEYYFHKGYIQSNPLLKGFTKEDCIYGSIYYQTMDERIFTSYPLALKKMFHILEDKFISQMIDLDKICTKEYGKEYEGSIFWKLWAENRGVKQIQDIDLKIPNSKNYVKD